MGPTRFDILFDKDGNPETPQEFEEIPSNEGKFFFKPKDDATQEDKDRCKVLNFIHHVLSYDMARSIPAGANGDEETEVLHVAEFEGLQLQVCVIYLKKKRCYATIKVVGDDGKAIVYDQLKETKVNGTSNGASNKKVKKNKHTKGGALIKEESKVEMTSTEDATAVPVVIDKEVLPGLVGQKTRRYLNHDWAPRWNPLVTALKDRMYEDFNKWGKEMYEILEDDHQSDAETQVDAVTSKGSYIPTGSKEEVEDTMQVFAGSIGKIIGSQGKTMYEIQDATHAKLEMPKKDDGGVKPRARELVTVILRGTQDNIELAKVKVQAIVDEWTSAPRPPRRDFNAVSSDNQGDNDTGGDAWANGGGGGGGDSWAAPAPIEAVGDWDKGSGDTANIPGTDSWGGGGSNPQW